MFQIHADKTCGNHVMARKTRLVSKFPVPVQLSLKSSNKSNLSETLNVGKELLERFPGHIKRARLEIAPLRPVFNARAFNMGTERQKVGFRAKYFEGDVVNPFPIPELPELEPNLLEPVRISAIYPVTNFSSSSLTFYYPLKSVMTVEI